MIFSATFFQADLRARICRLALSVICASTAATQGRADTDPTAQQQQPTEHHLPASTTAATIVTGAQGDTQAASTESGVPTFEEFGWGPFYWELPAEQSADNRRHEFAAGPFWEQRWGENTHDWFLRPLWSSYNNFEQDRHEGYMLIPLYGQRSGPLFFNWNVLQFMSYRRNGALDDNPATAVYIFPFFFYRDNPHIKEDNFWGVLPFYGEIRHFFSYRSLSWVLFPFYTRAEMWNETIRTGTPWPIIQTFSGPSEGLYIWPLWGHAWRENKYDNFFLFWPFIYRNIDQFEKSVPRVRQGVLPFYAFERGERVDDVSIMMFWGWRDDRGRKYKETRYFWPLFVQGRGEHDYVNRWAPFYTHSIHPTMDRTWYMWPLLQISRTQEKETAQVRTQFFYFLYWHEVQRSITNPEMPEATMTFVWPFVGHYDNGNGLRQTQILSPIEVFFPNNGPTRDTYAPLFALYRSESDDNKGISRWSLLWNLVMSHTVQEEEYFHIWPLYRSQTTKDESLQSDEFSILYGLFALKDETVTDTAVSTSASDDTAQAADAVPPATTTEDGSATVEEKTKTTLTLLWFIDIEL